MRSESFIAVIPFNLQAQKGNRSTTTVNEGHQPQVRYIQAERERESMLMSSSGGGGGGGWVPKGPEANL